MFFKIVNKDHNRPKLDKCLQRLKGPIAFGVEMSNWLMIPKVCIGFYVDWKFLKSVRQNIINLHVVRHQAMFNIKT